MLRRVRALNEIAQRRGQKLAQLALQWALRDARVTSAVIGASSVEQLDTNLDALDATPLTDEELADDRRVRRRLRHQPLGQVHRGLTPSRRKQTQKTRRVGAKRRPKHAESSYDDSASEGPGRRTPPLGRSSRYERSLVRGHGPEAVADLRTVLTEMAGSGTDPADPRLRAMYL